ncbi:DUF5685 family protein [Antrihabitans stalactiti]|uniref:DUF5685 family protein n=1 Tax=Antrihabitans stalactiti TaxID=2584121 RepID=UPI001F0F997A|nr:DUF5685 family protein [Antrihabitans stalactiti]
MFGIVRPCQHRLSEGMRTQWMAHLCGLCLALRDDHGQLARVATNYDGLIVSVLTEAQSDQSGQWRRTAGPCPLRGMRTASVAQGEGARLAAAVSLVLASAKVSDHIADRDGILARRPVAVAARKVAAGWDRKGALAGLDLGFDTAVLVDAVTRQTALETSGVHNVLTVTEPTETATAAAFAHTAVLAGRPQNQAALAEAGRLFGRLAHLLDAVEDQTADLIAGAWNPITATDTDLVTVRRWCDDAVTGVRLALQDVDFVDQKLAHILLAHELEHSVDRVFGTAGHQIVASNQRRGVSRRMAGSSSRTDSNSPTDRRVGVRRRRSTARSRLVRRGADCSPAARSGPDNAAPVSCAAGIRTRTRGIGGASSAGAAMIPTDDATATAQIAATAVIAPSRIG